MSKILFLSIIGCLASTGTASADPYNEAVQKTRATYVRHVNSLRVILSDLPKPLAKDWKHPAQGFKNAALLADVLLRCNSRVRTEFRELEFLPTIKFASSLRVATGHHLEEAARAKKANDQVAVETHQLLAGTYQSELAQQQAAMKKMKGKNDQAEQARGKLERYDEALVTLQRRSAQLNDLEEKERQEFEAKLQKASLAMADNLNQIVCQLQSFSATVEAVHKQLQPPKAKKKAKQKD